MNEKEKNDVFIVKNVIRQYFWIILKKSYNIAGIISAVGCCFIKPMRTETGREQSLVSLWGAAHQISAEWHYGHREVKTPPMFNKCDSYSQYKAV